MGKPIFLLGAGASIDAGLFDTNRLTREIYRILRSDHYAVPGKIFGYVIAKILARKVRNGGSPFDEVNVEEAYDGVERIVYRDRDIASEFVSSWDPFLDALRPGFNKDKFIRNIEAAIHLDDRRSFASSSSIRLDHYRMMDAAEEIERATSPSVFSEQANILPYLTNALLRCLKHDPSRIDYARRLAEVIDNSAGIIGSLNYDLVLEESFADLNLNFDYGLSSWNVKRVVRFSGGKSGTKLMKLHGSMNWHGTDDNIVVGESDRNKAPMLLFGGGGGKLRPDGPFLQLRHEFERQLLSTNVFVIIGYSFGDGHLNAIIRRWASTRRKAKLIVVDPGQVVFRREIFGAPYIVGKDGKLQSKTVDITHIQKNAALSVADVATALKRPINLAINTHPNGSLPDVLVRKVT